MDAPNIVVMRELIGLLGLLAIAIGIKQILNREEESTEIQAVNTDFVELLDPNPIFAVLLSIVHPNTYKVAAMKVANGRDNISIHTTLFAGQDLASLGIILAVFLGMLGVWCGITYLLSRQAAIDDFLLSRYGKAVVPFILIALGLFMMYERGTFYILLLKKN